MPEVYIWLWDGIIRQYNALATWTKIPGMTQRIGPELGRRLKQIRVSRKLTQAHLAELARKSVETISNFERGRTIPSVRTLVKLANILKVNAGAFFDEVPPTKETKRSPVDARLHLLTAEDVELVGNFVEMLYARRRKALGPRKRRSP
jgi:transcriptional regulator with XRE-family HTH domain